MNLAFSQPPKLQLGWSSDLEFKSFGGKVSTRFQLQLSSCTAFQLFGCSHYVTLAVEITGILSE